MRARLRPWRPARRTRRRRTPLPGCVVRLRPLHCVPSSPFIRADILLRKCAGRDAGSSTHWRRINADRVSTYLPPAQPRDVASGVCSPPRRHLRRTRVRCAAVRGVPCCRARGATRPPPSPRSVLRRDEFAACQWQEGDEVPPAQLVDILVRLPRRFAPRRLRDSRAASQRVHDVDYVRHVEATCRGLHERELQRVAAGAAVEELHAPHSTLDPAAPSALARASREWQPNAVTGSAVPGRSLIGSEHGAAAAG